MVDVRKKGYRTERKIRQFFEGRGWKVQRSGASLGESDLICMKKGKCVMLQIKSSSKNPLYYYEYMNHKLEGFDFFLVVDFGYGKIRLLRPQNRVTMNDGIHLDNFLKRPNQKI